MRTISRFGYLPILVMAVSLGLAGCKNTPVQAQDQDQSAPAQTQDQNQGESVEAQDQSLPADANLAPVNGEDVNGPVAAQPAQQSSSGTENPPPPPAASNANQNYSAQAQDNSSYSEDSADNDDYDTSDYEQDDNADYEDTQPVYAPQPPPELPIYAQPLCPGENYIWTPGYWFYSPAGYYWVPGAWVLAPYTGALWTPGFWEFVTGRFLFHHGYWGPYIGYYGGIRYGFGYTGVGYQGGYWDNGRFAYNRSVNNINITIIHNVYTRRVVYNIRNNGRVSYNGGRGGVKYHASRAELAALNVQRVRPLASQMRLRRQAAADRGQLLTVNHGHPQVFAEHQAVNGGRLAPKIAPAPVRARMRPTALPVAQRVAPQPISPRMAHSRSTGTPATNRRAGQQTRMPQQRSGQHQIEPQQQLRLQQQRPEQQRTPQRTMPQQRPQQQRTPQRTMQQQRPEQERMQQQRPEPQPRMEQQRPEQQRMQQPRPEPQPRMEQQRPEQQRAPQQMHSAPSGERGNSAPRQEGRPEV